MRADALDREQREAEASRLQGIRDASLVLGEVDAPADDPQDISPEWWMVLKNYATHPVIHPRLDLPSFGGRNRELEVRRPRRLHDSLVAMRPLADYRRGERRDASPNWGPGSWTRTMTVAMSSSPAFIAAE